MEIYFKIIKFILKKKRKKNFSYIRHTFMSFLI